MKFFAKEITHTEYLAGRKRAKAYFDNLEVDEDGVNPSVELGKALTKAEWRETYPLGAYSLAMLDDGHTINGQGFSEISEEKYNELLEAQPKA